MIRSIKQRVFLIALVSGLAAAAVGGAEGMPNSWAWFAGGAAVGVVWTLLTARRHRRRAQF